MKYIFAKTFIFNIFSYQQNKIFCCFYMQKYNGALKKLFIIKKNKNILSRIPPLKKKKEENKQQSHRHVDLIQIKT